MLDTHELNAFYSVLEKSPSDTLTQRALADWYEEHDQPQAATCLRWLAENKRSPFRYRRRSRKLLHHHDSWKNGWYWWTTAQEGDGWGYSPCCVLPHRIWRRLKHTFPYDPLVFKEYPTVRQAIETLIAAWPKPRRRTRSVRQTS